MNAIISLCHFCELHGPSVLYCTQAFHSNSSNQVLDHELLDESVFFTPEFAQFLAARASGPDSLGSDKGNQSQATTGASNVSSQPQQPRDMCEACRSLPPSHTGYISNDHDSTVSYVSSQHPHHPQVFAMVRQACVRSLSCEVCPGREGPIFFGDERGNVLSYTFFIRDSQARGFQRWYSIIVVMMDRIFLLNSWPFLVDRLRSVIGQLQHKAQTVYEDEQAKCPQRAHRLTLSMNPSNFLQQRGTDKPARSLCELTNDKQIFLRLHQVFTWILKTGGTRLTERLLEGPPTEDSIIDYEKQEETEEGFVKLFSKKDVAEEQTELGEDLFEDDVGEADCPEVSNLRQLLSALGYQNFHELSHHVTIGNQIVIRGRQRKLVKSIIDTLKMLLPKGCCRAIYYSKTYEDSWKCNFLGLPSGTSLPEHATLYVTMDIVEPEAQQTEAEAEQVEFDATSLKSYTFLINTPMQMPEKGPAVLTKMEAALMNEKLADSVVDQCLICLKEEWMNKVKVLFKFTKAGGNRSDEDTRKLLNVVGAKNEDKAVLQFWMTGLSVQYRNHMLSSAIQQTVNG